MKPEGELILNCSVKKCLDIPLKFIVVNVSSMYLDLKTCQILNFAKKIDQVNLMSKNEIINDNS